MTNEDLDDLREELNLYADRLGTLILPTWSNAFEILDELGELEETVEAHDLLGAWFSAYARVDSAVVMMTMPEIYLVSP
jgi:hypothetical protein